MATPEPQAPVESEDRVGKCDPHKVYDHPAFGTITLSTVHGGKQELFGSDLHHNDRIRICINEASLRRDLSRDWIMSGDQLIEIEMSHAQFAEFITSNGKGGGTPVTLKWVRGTGYVPSIEKVETKHETFKREIRDAAKVRLQHIRQGLESLKTLLEGGGSISKKELREIYANLERHTGQLPGTLSFVVESAEEALEKATSDAKIEIETYIQMTAQRLGLKHISELAALEHKTASVECSHIYSRAINQEYPRKCLHCGQPEEVKA